MKKLLVLAIVSLFAASAFAQDPGVDGIGIYFDEAGMTNHLASATPYSAVNAYVLGTNVSEPSGMSGYEFTIDIQPTPSIAPGYTQNGGGLNALTPPVFQVGACVLPGAPIIKMITIQLVYFGGEVSYYLGPCSPSSFGRFPYEDVPVGPGYAAGNDPGILVRLTPSSNAPHPTLADFFKVAGILGDPPVANVESSWGGVKALYE